MSFFCQILSLDRSFYVRCSPKIGGHLFACFARGVAPLCCSALGRRCCAACCAAAAPLRHATPRNEMDTPKALYACCACGLVGLAILAHVLLAAPAAPLQPAPVPPSIPLDDGLPPDLIRLASPMPDEARKCDVPLPPESHWTTKHGESSVAVFAHAAAEESHARDAEEEEPYRWSYRMELTNTGPTTVQLMTQHLVLTTADAVAEERKGAGARADFLNVCTEAYRSKCEDVDC